MNGLMLEIEDSLVRGITFCHFFADRENNTQSECMVPKIDKLQATGLPRVLAAKIVLSQEGYINDTEDGPQLYIAPDIR